MIPSCPKCGKWMGLARQVTHVPACKGPKRIKTLAFLDRV